MTENNHTDSVEQQQIGAYGTYHKSDQKTVPLLVDEDQQKGTNVQPTQDRAQ